MPAALPHDLALRLGSRLGAPIRTHLMVASNAAPFLGRPHPHPTGISSSVPTSDPPEASRTLIAKANSQLRHRDTEPTSA